MRTRPSKNVLSCHSFSLSTFLMNTHKKTAILGWLLYIDGASLPIIGLLMIGLLNLAVYLVLFTVRPFDGKDAFVTFHVPCVDRFWV